MDIGFNYDEATIDVIVDKLEISNEKISDALRDAVTDSLAYVESDEYLNELKGIHIGYDSHLKAYSKIVDNVITFFSERVLSLSETPDKVDREELGIMNDYVRLAFVQAAMDGTINLIRDEERVPLGNAYLIDRAHRDQITIGSKVYNEEAGPQYMKDMLSIMGLEKDIQSQIPQPKLE